MMLDVVAENLAQAVTVAVSPMPLIGLIVLMVAGTRAAALTWSVGWFVAVGVMTGVAATVGASTPVGSASDETGVNYLAFALAGLFLWLSWRSFAGRPAPGSQAEEPEWLATLGSMSIPKVFGLSILLMTLNAKNLPIYAAMGTSISNANLTEGQSVLAIVILALVGSVTAIVVVGIALLGGDDAAELLEKWRVWLVQNNATVMGTLFLVLGFTQLGNAIGSL